MKRITYTKQARKALQRMPKNIASTIEAKIEQYAADPASLANNVIAMKGMPGHFRMRVGDWRVIFTEDGEVIAIIKIASRGDVYDK